MSTTNMLVWGPRFYTVLKHKYATFDIHFKNKYKLIIKCHHCNRFHPYYIGIGTTVRVQHMYEYLIVHMSMMGALSIKFRPAANARQFGLVVRAYSLPTQRLRVQTQAAV